MLVFDGGEGGFGDGFEGPELALLTGDGVGGSLDCFDFNFGPKGTVFNPLFKRCDFRFGYLGAAEGHLHLVVGMFDGLDKEGVCDVAGDDGGAGFAAFEEAVTGGHGETAERCGGVATEAAVGEDGADLEFEVLGWVRRGGRERGRDYEDSVTHVGLILSGVEGLVWPPALRKVRLGSTPRIERRYLSTFKVFCVASQSRCGY